MGKLFITNTKKFSDILTTTYNSVDFRENGTYSNCNILLKTYSKLNVDTFNFYECKNNFVACSGTLIYNKKLGREALVNIFESVENGATISEIRSKCVGMYVLAIKSGDIIRVFVDKTNAYAFYYWYNKTNFLATNTYYHIEKCVHEEINVDAFLEVIQEGSILCNDTPFKNVRRLLKNDCLKINTSDHTFSVEKIKINQYTLKAKDFSSVIAEIADLLLEYSTSEKVIPYEPLRFCTGGVDSRVALAADLASGQKPVIGIWYGSPTMMNTKWEDREISEIIAREMGLDFNAFDVKEKITLDIGDVSSTHFDKFGEYGTIYSANQKWYNIFDNKSLMKFLKFGFFGETLKQWEALDASYKEDEEWTLENYTNLYVSRRLPLDDKKTYPCLERHYNFLLNKIKKIAQEESIHSLSHLTKEDCMVLYYRYRENGDMMLCNMINMFAYCTNGLADNKIAQYINQIPYSFKVNDKLSIALCNKLFPSLAKLPFFTHCIYRYLDTKTNELKLPAHITRRAAFREILMKNAVGRGLLAIRRKIKRVNTNKYANIVRDIKNLDFYEHLGRGGGGGFYLNKILRLFPFILRILFIRENGQIFAQII